MNIYFWNVVFVLCAAIVFPFLKRLYLVKPRINIGVLIISIFFFLILFFEMAFRGDFAIDIFNYKYIFDSSSDNLSSLVKQDNFWLSEEILFQFLNTLVRQFKGNFLHFQMITASVMSLAYVKFFKENSPMIWLSFLILFCSGSFYTGFNLIRQLLVVALCLFGYKYIETKEFIKYLLLMVLISGIHISTLIMIPAYFFFNIKWKKKNSVIVLGIVISLTLCAYFFSDMIVSFVTNFVYSDFVGDDAFGMSYGVGILGTLKSVVMASGILLNYKRFDMTNIKERIVYNGTVLYLIFAVVGSNIFMIQRFTHFFIPCLMIGYPILLTKIQSSKNRQFATLAAVCFFIATGLNVILDGDYYFYWDNQTLIW